MVNDKNRKWYIIGSAMFAFIAYMFVGPRLVAKPEEKTA